MGSLREISTRIRHELSSETKYELPRFVPLEIPNNVLEVDSPMLRVDPLRHKNPDIMIPQKDFSNKEKINEDPWKKPRKL